MWLRALKTLGESPVVTGWVGGSAGRYRKDYAEAFRPVLFDRFRVAYLSLDSDETNQLVTEIRKAT